MAMRDALLSEFNQEMTNTRRMLERVPDNRLDFQPHAKSFRMNRLAGHVADLVSWATYTLQTHMLELEVAKFVPFDPSSTQELLSRFDKNVREARAALEESSEDDLYAIWTMKREGQIVMTMPRINVLRSMVMKPPGPPSRPARRLPAPARHRGAGNVWPLGRRGRSRERQQGGIAHPLH